jgi:hypothetical protein
VPRMPVAPFRPSLAERLLAAWAARLDHTVDLWRLPRYTGGAVLAGLRVRLRQRNLHDTEALPSTAPDPAPAQPTPGQLTARTTDGTWNDLDAPAMGSANTRFGRNVEREQPAFDLERERREPAWGDPSWRRLPGGAAEGGLGMAHLHVNPADILADRNVALPVDVLARLVGEGLVGGATADHLSVMGYQEHGLAGWRDETVPAMVELLREQGADAVVLAPV